MDLDTNAKSFKYSKTNKILCAILCIATFFSSLLIGGTSSLVYSYNRMNVGTITANPLESRVFKDKLVYDASNILGQMHYGKFCEELGIKFDKKKNETVDFIYNEYNNIYYDMTDEIISLSDEDYTSDEIESELENTYQLSKHLFDSNDISYTFFINPVSIYYNTDESEKAVKNYITSEYERYVGNCMADGDFDLSRLYGSYIVHTYSNTYGNDDESSLEIAEENSPYVIYKNGKLDTKGLPQSVVTELEEELITKDSKNDECIFAIWFSEFPSTLECITSNRYWNDDYACIFAANSICNRLSGVNLLLMIFSAVLLIASFVLGFISMTISGKKNKNDKAKLIITDKVPFILHLGLTAGLIVLLNFVFIGIYENLSDISYVFVIAFASFFTICQMLLFEFCSSVARVCGSERSLGDNLLSVAISKRIKKAYMKVSATFGYKPKAITKNAMALGVLYFVINFILVLVTALLYMTLEPVGIIIAIWLTAVFVVVNAIIIVRFLDYIRKLDIIITAFRNKQEIPLDINTLPQSLRVLSESMKYTTDELNSAVQQAVKDERLRSELITNVSHDLKTPLTSIITYVDLLSKCNIEDENAKSYIRVLDEKGARLKRLIDDLIEASKVTSGNVTVNITSINMSELCLQSTVEAQSDFEKANLQLVVKNTEKPVIVQGDGSKTFRVIENLLSNARKYSASGSRVYVDVFDENNYGVFEIKNISAQALDISPDELTERFVRGDKSRHKEGNGLGLSIAKELCKLQDGQLVLTIDGDLFKARVMLPKTK